MRRVRPLQAHLVLKRTVQSSRYVKEFRWGNLSADEMSDSDSDSRSDDDNGAEERDEGRGFCKDDCSEEVDERDFAISDEGGAAGGDKVEGGVNEELRERSANAYSECCDESIWMILINSERICSMACQSGYQDTG